jgi:branched-chain amino acid transport system ATP-binding protein
MTESNGSAKQAEGAHLSLNGLRHSYGALEALRDVTLEVRAGTVVSVLGPNGAGKSTLASAIAGVIPTSAGSVILDGIDVSRERRYKRARRGVAHVPEHGGVFPALTVVENLVVGDRRASRSYRKAIVDEAAELFPFLAARSRERAGMLSGGEQQMLSLSRILVHKPSLVVIDELSHGLAPAILDRLFEVLSDFRGRMTFVIVEQYVKRAHSIADDVVVLSYGKVSLAGTASSMTLVEIEDAYDLNAQPA